jgi:hypothetical protein
MKLKTNTQKVLKTNTQMQEQKKIIDMMCHDD